jgi:hypothetical protein
MNFFEILRGFGEFGETLDPSCGPGGSQEGKCGGEPYVPWAEFYALAGRPPGAPGSGRQLWRGYDDGGDGPSMTATINTGGQTTCRGPSAVKCKTTDPFEIPGVPNPGDAIGASAMATFSDVVVIETTRPPSPTRAGRPAATWSSSP